ncbi:TIGR03759 family integrating conjugative element protein [Pseudomonas sp. GD03858]|uniref:TIGR03759 family integrating conjugative element protein n=1 Tax=unclassified Pseudomonas TaxID=196821 RepID=UPI00244798E8|nr:MULTISPECIES: TIGR03759 family integrating conjugative element protein [unclassified Pseudomonas]MDH0645223.1 TIGR03759 family integrating conjugative element protein [Pseudomonas sp. GD03867]MDH0660845.1 TIGR03759 family integrating conjugative element protein [Pseudomonas sp. GD03858]
MARFMTLSLLLFPIYLIPGSGWSAPATVETEQQSSEQAPLQQARSAAQAKAWGLTDDEWAKFERLQSGQRQYWSPQLDPLTTLGVEADSDQERQRYAELQVRLEAKRAERELAYQKAYSAAWTRLFPGLLPVQGMSDAVSPSDNVRYAVFVEETCSNCEASLRQWLSTGAHLDVYLVGSQGDDARIRQWARKVGISAAQIGSGQVTLNHDRGRWFALGASRPLPARFQQVEGKWQRVD